MWQESFARAAGFPQDHPQFAGHLPWRRRQMRETLAPHDLVVVIGTNAFRLYILDDSGSMVEDTTRVAVLTDDPSEAHRSPCALAIVAPVASACAALVEEVAERDTELPSPLRRPAPPPPPAAGDPLLPGHVYTALAERLPREAVIVEETPSSQPELYQRVPVRHPRGYVACGNGGLGFGVSGSVGLRMGNPERPVVGVVGDGSSMYAIQALWSAAHYEVGVLLLVMANGRYAVMDRLAPRRRRPRGVACLRIDRHRGDGALPRLPRGQRHHPRASCCRRSTRFSRIWPRAGSRCSSKSRSPDRGARARASDARADRAARRALGLRPAVAGHVPARPAGVDA